MLLLKMVSLRCVRQPGLIPFLLEVALYILNLDLTQRRLRREGREGREANPLGLVL